MIRLIRRLEYHNIWHGLILRKLHMSQINFIFWKKTIKASEDHRQIEVTKLSDESSHMFELSEHKIKEMELQKQNESVEFIKNLIFEETILMYMTQYGKTRRGHVQFVEACLKKIKDYNLHKSLSTYKKILEIIPEVKFIPKTFWQTEFYHYPRQQDCAIDILVAMEENFVIPDEDFGRMIYKRFGLHSSPMVRYQRMMYWFPKFRNENPWPLPQILPADLSEVARLVLTRINPVKETKVMLTEVQINEFEKTWIAQAQSNLQKKLIVYLKGSFDVPKTSSNNSNEDTERAVYVDGPCPVWVRDKQVNYYMLTTELDKDRLQHHEQFMTNQNNENEVKFDKWYTSFDPNADLPVHFGNSTANDALPSSLTSYEDTLDNRTVLATCMIGSESVAGLRLWVNMLVKDNPALNDFRIVFRLSSRPSQLVA